MERKILKSVGLDKEEYLSKSKEIIESLKVIREKLLKAQKSNAQWQLLFDLLVAIDSMLGNKEYFRMSLSLAISADDDYLTLSYYEGQNLSRRIYDDVDLLPTYCIIKKDLSNFYFVKECEVLPNPEHRGRQINYEISSYTYEDNSVSLKKFNESDFAFKVNQECLETPKEFVARLEYKCDE